jgi:hypothetical protein
MSSGVTACLYLISNSGLSRGSAVTSTSISGISLSSQMLVSSVLPLETSTAHFSSPLLLFGPIFPGPVALEDIIGFVLNGIG